MDLTTEERGYDCTGTRYFVRMDAKQVAVAVVTREAVFGPSFVVMEKDCNPGKNRTVQMLCAFPITILISSRASSLHAQSVMFGVALSEWCADESCVKGIEVDVDDAGWSQLFFLGNINNAMVFRNALVRGMLHAIIQGQSTVAVAVPALDVHVSLFVRRITVVAGEDFAAVHARAWIVVLECKSSKDRQSALPPHAPLNLDLSARFSVK